MCSPSAARVPAIANRKLTANAWEWRDLRGRGGADRGGRAAAERGERAGAGGGRHPEREQAPDEDDERRLGIRRRRRREDERNRRLNDSESRGHDRDRDDRGSREAGKRDHGRVDPDAERMGGDPEADPIGDPGADAESEG